jgi:Glyoxalase-like domain
MSVKFQVTFDCAQPSVLARFWMAALGYELDPPPDGFDTWEAFLESIGVPEDEWDTGASIVDPEGIQPRLFFQQVPEGKTVKNRLHLDLHVSQGRSAPLEQRRSDVKDAVARLEGIGATKLYESADFDRYHVTMADPEGSEFCLT